MSGLSGQQPTVLFSIYQKNTWIIRHLIDETINPATQRIILKIVGFDESEKSHRTRYFPNASLFNAAVPTRKSLRIYYEIPKQLPEASGDKTENKTQ